MYTITGKDFTDVFKQSILKITAHGEVVAPRGTQTYELAPATLVIEDARKFLAMPRLRKGNYTFQLAEALWMLRGSNDLEEIAHYNRVWRYFEDEDNKGILNGAYGERLRNWNGEIDQFMEVYLKLKKDPYSRQATMVIFDPERDNQLHGESYSKDIPCTNYFNFQIRNGKLNMLTVMRSNDLHKGTLYDIPNFIIFQHILAGWLEVEVGKYTHVAASFHMYESDVENFIDIYNDKEDITVYEDGVDYGDPRLSLSEFNLTMSNIMSIEHATRTYSPDKVLFFPVQTLIMIIKQIENTWWRSVAAQIAMYNYRKLGANKEDFMKFLPLITNEYRQDVEKWEAIK